MKLYKGKKMNINNNWLNLIIFYIFDSEQTEVTILVIFHNQTFDNNKHKAEALAAILKSQTEDCGVVQ